jgi:hypothetical protein
MSSVSTTPIAVEDTIRDTERFGFYEPKVDDREARREEADRRCYRRPEKLNDVIHLYFNSLRYEHDTRPCSPVAIPLSDCGHRYLQLSSRTGTKRFVDHSHTSCHTYQYLEYLE